MKTKKIHIRKNTDEDYYENSTSKNTDEGY